MAPLYFAAGKTGFHSDGSVIVSTVKLSSQKINSDIMWLPNDDNLLMQISPDSFNLQLVYICPLGTGVICSGGC